MDSSVNDLKNVIRRRKGAFLFLFIPIFLGGTLLSITLPPVYRSQATILFDEKMQTGSSSRRYGDVSPSERIDVLTQQVLSRARLFEICERYGLFQDGDGLRSPENRAENLRKALVIQPVGNPMAEAAAHRPAPSSVAFSITFEAGDPKVAQQVTDAIAVLYISENRKARDKQRSDATLILEREVAGIKNNIEASAARLSRFKTEHWGELPDHEKQNLQALEKLDGEIDRQTAQIATLEQRKVYLEGQLAILEPTITVDIPASPDDPTPKLTELRLKMIELEARVSPEHPDLKQIKRELSELEARAKADVEGQKELIEARLSQIEREAAIYGPDHPDAIRLKAEREALLREASLISAQTSLSQAVPGPTQRIQDNPAYINVKTQLASTELEIKGRLLERKRLEKKIADYEILLARIPGVEREYTALVDELESQKKRYSDLVAKLQDARLLNNAEQTEQGERFVVVDPAGRAERPSRPNRLAILMLSAAIALGAGFGGAALRETTDPSIRSVDELAQISGVPILGVFPVVSSKEATKWKRFMILALALALGLCAAGSFSIFGKNPDLYLGYWDKVRQHVHLPWEVR